MFKRDQRKTWFALLALLLLLAACKGETPTAPPPGGPPGGTPPPTGVNVVVSVSNADPLVDSSVVITATVTNNGAIVPDGTAVEFETTHGLFTDTGAQKTIRTTTNGVATATLSASSPGVARITVVVNNVSRNTEVTFRARPVTPPIPPSTPTITSIVPAIGSPAGGQIIRITGTNFKPPVKVLFDLGGPLPVEALVVSATENQIEVITPSVNLGAEQQLAADIIVLTQAGTTNEQRVSAPDGFTFRNELLTPIIRTLSPASGPIGGGTMVQILGEGFQAPVQVFFGAAEARVVEVNFATITVEAPAGRDTSPDGSGTVTGPVAVSVLNMISGRTATSPTPFRYVANMVITAVGPGGAQFNEPTRVTIDGVGFVAPVSVVVRTGQGDIPLQPLNVSGTQIIARTSVVALRACDDITGTIVVTNINNGDSATGTGFTFFVPQPTIVDVEPAVVTAGGSTVITVANAIPGVTRIRLGTFTVFPTAQTFDPATGIGTFTVTVPDDFDFPTEACGVEGERELPLRVDVTYLNVESTCTDTAPGALTVNPCSPLPCPCVEPPAPPPPDVTMISPIPPACADAGPDSVATATGATAPITIRNDGGQDLTVVRTLIAGPNAAEFTVTPASLLIAPGASGTFTVTFTAAGAPGPRSATVNFTTNDPDPAEGSISICLQGTAAP